MYRHESTETAASAYYWSFEYECHFNNLQILQEICKLYIYTYMCVYICSWFSSTLATEIISNKLITTDILLFLKIGKFSQSLSLLPYSAQLMYSLWTSHVSHIYGYPYLHIRSQENKTAKGDISDLFCPLAKAPQKVSHITSLKIHLNDWI